MPWTVEVTQQFEIWWDTLDEEERVSVDGMIRVLEKHGPTGPPFTSEVTGSQYAQLRQLRVPHQPREMCVLHVADEESSVVVLLTGADIECEHVSTEMVTLADAIYETYRRTHNGSDS